MIKKIKIVSLSSGLLGESFVEHSLKIGLERLNKYGVEVDFATHALKGISYIKDNPKSRAKDLLEAFCDDSTDMILCAIGGEDTYRLLPYLFDNDELKNSVKQKIFLGFSDTTINHFMLNKVGIKTFYGQAFLPDVCELSSEMLPYTRQYFEELITTGQIKEIRPSKVWYSERTDFSKAGVGIDMQKHENTGFELLCGKSVFSGQILGGCIDSIYCMFANYRFSDSVDVCKKYNLLPPIKDWEHKILLLETSEEKPTPEQFKKMILAIKEYGIFDVISGVLFGKPQDEVYYDEYKSILLEEISNKNCSVVVNVNVGHATPRCIIPFGVDAEVNIDKQVISFTY